MSEIMQPRDQNGQFISKNRVAAGEEMIEFTISEYECRVIGNRLSRASRRYRKETSEINSRIHQDCNYWSKKFLEECSTREENDEEYYEKGKKRHTDSNYNIVVELTDYECWSLGNRLFELGQVFEEQGDDRVASETKWLARRFHAERNE